MKNVDGASHFHFFADFLKKPVLSRTGEPLGLIHDIAFSLSDAYRTCLPRGEAGSRGGLKPLSSWFPSDGAG